MARVGWLVLTIGLLAPAVAGDVSLEFLRVNQQLDIRCSFLANSSLDISHISSLVLSREDGDNSEVLATASVYEDGNENLLGATKTSALFADMSSESFVNLRWTAARSDLDGDYKCELNGFDKDNQHVLLFKDKTLKLTDTDPILTLKPEVAQVGLTRMLTLNCSVNSMSDLKLKQIISILLTAVREGQDEHLTSVDIFDGTKIFPGSQDANVTAQLGTKVNYLATSWVHPSTVLNGGYQCEVTALDSNSKPAHFIRLVNVSVTDPTQDQLVSHIHSWEQQYDDTVKDLTGQLDAALDEIDYLNRTRQVVRSCDELLYDVGSYKKTLVTENGTGIDVICDVEAVGKVWTVFQKRFDNSVAFNRDFASYEDGFGDMDGEFWLGLRNIHELMAGKTHTLRLKMKSGGSSYSKLYSTFGVGAGPDYKLSTGRNGEANGLWVNDGSAFSTKDHGPKKNCPSTRGGGWWFSGSNCGYTNMNGQARLANYQGMFWYPISTNQYLTETEMAFRAV